MLQTADVIKIECAFVKSVYDYIYHRQYTTDLCLDKVKSAYLLMLKAHNTCLTYEQECEVIETEVTDYTLDCTTSITTPCSTVGEITVSSSRKDCTYTAALRNPVNNTGFPYVDLQDNEVYHKGKMNIVITSPCSSYSTTLQAETGTILIGSPVTSDIYDFSVFASYIIDNVTSLSTYYISSIRLYATDSSGNVINSAIDIDISPTTSPYLSCPSCTTVTPSHLYFGHANYTTALKNVIDNAIRVISGSPSNASIEVTNVNTTGYEIRSRIKHNPSGVFYGIKHTDPQIIYTNGTTIVKSNQATKSWVNAGMYYTSILNGLCSPFTVTLPNRFYPLSVNWSNTDFNKITLNSPYSTQYTIMSNPTYITCPRYSASATITPTASSIVWKNDSDVTISTTDSMNTFSTGDYSITATFHDGCFTTEEFTIS